MQPYLVLQTLGGPKGLIDPGAVTYLHWCKPDTIKILVRRRAVRPIKAPPFSELHGWSGRAKILSELDVFTPWEFLALAKSSRSTLLGVFSPEEVQEMETTLVGWFGPPEAIDLGRARD